MSHKGQIGQMSQQGRIEIYNDLIVFFESYDFLFSGGKVRVATGEKGGIKAVWKTGCYFVQWQRIF